VKRCVAVFVVLGLFFLLGCLPDIIDPNPNPTPGTSLFFDDFNGGISSGFAFTSGTWEETDGEIHPITDEGTAHVVGGDSWTDYEASADFRFDDLETLNHNTYRGLAVRVQGQRKVVFIGNHSYMEFREYHPDIGPSYERMGFRVTEGMPLVCNVRVRVVGNRFQAYINDVLMAEVEDVNGRYLAGTAGIVVDTWSNENIGDSFFDNFRVTALGQD
jgi:hypothetical protein